MIRYLIVDDEPLAHDLIVKFCDMLPHLKLAGSCYSAMEAADFLSKKSVDVMFLDLNMPQLKGFEFLRTLRSPPQVIVTTAYKEYALEGYELNIADYLLKPFSFERLVLAINKAISGTQSSSIQPTVDSANKRWKFFVKGDKKYHQLDTAEVLFVEAYGNYSKIHMADKTIISHEKISQLETILEGEQFMRIHKSFVVSLDKIDLIEGNRVIIEGHKIPIGQTYKNQVSKLYS